MTQLPANVAEYFPYAEARPFQDDFIRTIAEAVESGRSVLIEGSNGLGKTVAALSGSLPTAAEKGLKILYVARTHRQHDRVIEELKQVSRKQRVSGVSIRGRHEMCLNSFVTRHVAGARAVMEACELLKARDRCAYYRGIKERKAEYSDLQNRVTLRPYTASEIQMICRKRGFCPYELTKASATHADVVALSYLYVFDPEIRNVFLKNLDTSLSKIILVVDEAHNLPETAIDIGSSSLTLFAMRQAEAEAKEFREEDIAVFARILRDETEKIAERSGKEAVISPEFLTEIMTQKAGVDDPLTFFENLQAVGYSVKRRLLADGKYPRSYIFGMAEFLPKWAETRKDPSFVNVISRYTSRRGTPTAKLEVVALDPSTTTAPVFSATHSNVIMSGTLQPLEAYSETTGLPEDTVKKVVPSPFPKEHVLPLICDGVTTAMEKRTPSMYSKIVARIVEVVEGTPANTGVFAASFEVLQALLATGLEQKLGKPLLHEQRGMSSKENEGMVADFKAHAHRGGAVLLAVQGGRSSEGVDYPGDEMNSVVIVGVPYAEPTPKVKAQIGYFEKRFPGLGREYGYVIPAMKKASQTAGRPMRTLEDRASMVFLDSRFSSAYCQRFLPSWIRANLRTLPDKDGAISRELSGFFKKAS
jgi:DNA excision repair protein ERCC-2